MPALQMLDFQVLASRTVVVPDGLGGTSVVPHLLVGNRKSPRVILKEARVLTVMEINLKQRANQNEDKHLEMIETNHVDHETLYIHTSYRSEGFWDAGRGGNLGSLPAHPTSRLESAFIWEKHKNMLKPLNIYILWPGVTDLKHFNVSLCTRHTFTTCCLDTQYTMTEKCCLGRELNVTLLDFEKLTVGLPKFKCLNFQYVTYT